MQPVRAFTAAAMMMWLLFGCKKQSEILPLSSANSYYPLQTGKRFTYRLDSTLYVSFGTIVKINSYLAKDSIINTFQDNLGRTSYLVYRYLTDTLQQHPFTFNSNYYITPANNTIEVTDANNLRYIKLTEPVTETNTWQGNAFIDPSSEKTGFLSDWRYQYQNINMPFSVLDGNIDSTLTVLQVDVPSLIQPFDPNYYQSSLYSSEVYAKGIGLIYKDFNYWVWQPLNSISPGYTAESYGIRLNLIEHN